MGQDTDDKKSNLGLIGWILFIVGILLLFNGLGNFIFYGPIFLTTFIIAIILMTRRQVGSGVSLLLLTLILPPLLWFGIFVYKVGDTMKTIEQNKKIENEEKSQYVKFEDIKISHEGGYMYCEGKVRNNGASTYKFIKVKVEWLDENNIVLDTDYTYAVGGEGLAPDEAKSFKVMTPRDRKMKSARYYITDSD